MQNIKVLDCTLRDGGYYNNWDFDPELAQATVRALARSGVEVIEIGYKSNSTDKFYGLYKYCNERLLQWLHSVKGTEFAFMIDLKEFCEGNQLNKGSLDEVIVSEPSSVFHWVRIAIRTSQIEPALEAIDYFNALGYKIALNLMGGSLIELEDLTSVLKRVEGKPVEVLYLADSFGSFYPEDISRYYQHVKKHYSGDLGFHAHDNQGMAYVNAIQAIKEGVKYIDGTIYGMGRGAGNLRIEQFLLGMREKFEMNQYKPFHILQVLYQNYIPLQQKYGWGASYVYMMSGLKDIHQSYVQELSDHNQYTLSQISRILDEIPKKERSKFNSAELTTALKRSVKIVEEEGLDTIPHERVDQLGEAVVICANGPGLKSHIEAVRHFSLEHGAKVLECNNTGQLRDVKDKIVVILNRVRLLETLSDNSIDAELIITGEQFIPGELLKPNLRSVQYELGEIYDNSVVNISSYEAGQLCVSWAIHKGATKIYLAGFDGYDSLEENQEMDDFFLGVKSVFGRVEITAITPTKYQNLSTTSVYALIK